MRGLFCDTRAFLKAVSTIAVRGLCVQGGFFLHHIPIDFQAWKYEYEYLFNLNHFSFGC